MRKKETAVGEKGRRRPVTLLIVLAAVAAFCIVALAFAEPIGNAISSLLTPETEEPSKRQPVGFFDGNYADWELDEWAQLNRYIAYTVGGETMELTDDTVRYFGAESEVFLAFFRAITEGDAKAYAALFTDAYFETNERIASFDRQLAYDIEVVKESETTAESGARTIRFTVGYKLYHNNGTLRRDIGSGACRPQIFTLVETPDGFRIGSISAIRQG